MTRLRALQRAGSALGLLLATPACMAIHEQRVGPGEFPTVTGPAVRDNRTPMEGALACFADQMVSAHRPPLIIGVGEIRDYTGKYNINEGNAITQGGALMAYSALGKLGGAVQIAERFDPSIAERELGYTDHRQLGDGDIHDLAGPQGQQQVPWLPYYGGTIIRSDYYIVGGITELNYDIGSGGLEVQVNQVGPKARIFNESIAIDLRIVDTKTLMVVKTISLTKQLTGFEVGAGIFRFFGSDLFDVNVGAKAEEPLQLGIRTTIEEGVMRLVGAISKADPEPCMAQRIGGHIADEPADALRKTPTTPAILTSRAPARRVAVNMKPLDAGASGPTFEITFDFGAAGLAGGSLDAIDRLAVLAAKGRVELLLTARDTEVFDGSKRDALIDQRIAAVVAALGNRGVPPGAITTVWRPETTDATIRHAGPGRQQIARLRIGG